LGMFMARFVSKPDADQATAEQSHDKT